MIGPQRPSRANFTAPNRRPALGCGYLSRGSVRTDGCPTLRQNIQVGHDSDVRLHGRSCRGSCTERQFHPNSTDSRRRLRVGTTGHAYFRERPGGRQHVLRAEGATETLRGLSIAGFDRMCVDRQRHGRIGMAKSSSNGPWVHPLSDHLGRAQVTKIMEAEVP